MNLLEFWMAMILVGLGSLFLAICWKNLVQIIGKKDSQNTEKEEKAPQKEGVHIHIHCKEAEVKKEDDKYRAY